MSTTHQTPGQLDARARDLSVSPYVRWSTARALSALSPAQCAELSARLRRSVVRLSDSLESCSDDAVASVMETHGDAWELLAELETISTVRSALLVAEMTP